MSNPMITVISALYGAPGAVVDVTTAVQGIFDQQYENNTNKLAYMLQISSLAYSTSKIHPRELPKPSRSFTICRRWGPMSSCVARRTIRT